MSQHSEQERIPLTDLLEGTVSLLLAIKKNHPEVSNSVTAVSKRVTTVVAQKQFGEAASELKGLAQTLHRTWQDEAKTQSSYCSDVAERLAALPLDHFSKKQKERFNGLLSCLRRDVLSPRTLSETLSEVLSDFSETIESLHKSSFGDRGVETGEYSKGINAVKKADLAAVTVRMTKDLKRLMHQIQILHPGDAKVTELNDRFKALDNDRIHFFEMVDLLSECAWLIYRINDSAIATQRDYLMSLVEQISNFPSNGSETSALVDSSEQELIEFNEILTEEMNRIKEESHDASSLSDLKQILNQKMELLRDKLNTHVERQSQIIDDQKQQIETQNSAIRKLKESGESYKRELKEASKKSLVDHLTQLPNRRAFDHKIKNLHENWLAGDIKYLSTIMIDIDYFKAVNDRYGHSVGDQALQHVSQLISNYCLKLPHAFSSRFGGEEFAMLVHSSNPKRILAIAKAINELIASNPLKLSVESIDLSVSVGICFFSEKMDSTDKVLKGADRALYRAKENGRNRVWVANKVEGL